MDSLRAIQDMIQLHAGSSAASCHFSIEQHTDLRRAIWLAAAQLVRQVNNTPTETAAGAGDDSTIQAGLLEVWRGLLALGAANGAPVATIGLRFANGARQAPSFEEDLHLALDQLIRAAVREPTPHIVQAFGRVCGYFGITVASLHRLFLLQHFCRHTGECVENVENAAATSTAVINAINALARIDSLDSQAIRVALATDSLSQSGVREALAA